MLNDDVRAAILRQVACLLSDERKRAHLSMHGLAAQAGLSQSLISTFESKPWNPTLDSLLRIASVLEVDLGGVIQRATAQATGSATSKSEPPPKPRRS